MSYLPESTRYTHLPYRRCGQSGVKLPEVSLGLWHNFGGRDEFENGRAIVRAAFDAGITHFDLANNYGPPPGSAEENFGKMLSTDLASYRDELFISTKAGYYMWPGPYGEWGSRKYIVSSLDQSLKRMGLKYVDLFFSHRPDPEAPMEETMMALDYVVRSGRALYVGLSNYSPDQTRMASSILKSLGTPCLIHQPKYNMLERTPENELLQILKNEGMGCIAFSPLAQGVLTNRYLEGIPSDSRVAKGVGFLRQEHLSAEKLEKVRSLNELAGSRGQSLAQMALAWVLRHEGMTSVLIGASSVSQLKDNIQMLGKKDFTRQELLLIDQILK